MAVGLDLSLQRDHQCDGSGRLVAQIGDENIEIRARHCDLAAHDGPVRWNFHLTDRFVRDDIDREKSDKACPPRDIR